MEIFDNITKVVRDDLKERIKPAPAVLCCRKYGAGFYYNKIAARQQRKHMSSL